MITIETTPLSVQLNEDLLNVTLVTGLVQLSVTEEAKVAAEIVAVPAASNVTVGIPDTKLMVGAELSTTVTLVV